jgi:hypothetical protein
MSDENLAAATALLADKVSVVEGAIRAARSEISTANGKIDELQRAQQKTRSDLAGVQGQLGQLGLEQAALRPELTARMQELEGALAGNTQALQSQQALLSSILAAQKEEAARRTLEAEKSAFLNRVSTLLSATDDRIVRLLIAQRAKQVCEAREISSGSFTGLADKAVADSILARLAAIDAEATDQDRAEAVRYEDMRTLDRDLQSQLASHRAAVARNDDRRRELLGKQSYRRGRIDNLQKRNQEAGQSEQFLAAIGTFFRSLAIAWHKLWLDRSTTLLAEAAAEEARIEQTARATIRSTTERLRALGCGPQDADTDAPVAPALQNLSRMASDLHAQWLAQHPEVRLLGS